jgi:hypothetical protein
VNSKTITEASSENAADAVRIDRDCGSVMFNEPADVDQTRTKLKQDWRERETGSSITRGKSRCVLINKPVTGRG